MKTYPRRTKQAEAGQELEGKVPQLTEQTDAEDSETDEEKSLRLAVEAILVKRAGT